MTGGGGLYPYHSGQCGRGRHVADDWSGNASGGETTSAKVGLSGSARIKRRDFLAGAGLIAFTGPLIARAAFAQSGTAPPADTRIARLAIYPALGISRVGNSSEWFLAPEVPGIPAMLDGRYKDSVGRIKQQVQRFRIFGFNKAGEAV